MIVGVVGPRESCVIIRKAIQQIDQSHEVRLYTRELVREAVDVIDTCEQECDGVIFTGSGICDYVLGHHQMQKPYTYIRRSASSIAEVFLKMVREGREIDTFSIDVVEKQIIEDILDAFHIQPRNIYTCPLLAGVAEEEYVAWHMELLEKKMTDVAVTAYVAVYHMIEEKAAGFLPGAQTLPGQGCPGRSGKGLGPGPGRVFADCGGIDTDVQLPGEGGPVLQCHGKQG